MSVDPDLHALWEAGVPLPIDAALHRIVRCFDSGDHEGGLAEWGKTRRLLAEYGIEIPE